ncbi:response regulator [Legionella sp. km772]|uniref:response regulator n=1 Tax=Legionella sp. km772 TaxID=2498111 RepID=UPI000F8C3D9A|nr:response regulator [Legionella sp. km772]RUR10158.1 response regulator [Legionella sp. km772]
MRVLIIEDNEFNAFCLRRLLESVMIKGSVSIVNNSNAALALFYSHPFDLVIIDGDLGAARIKGAYCNGPELAQILLYKYPQLAVVAWTDSPQMRQDFSQVFKQHERLMNGFNLWNKTVTIETICKTWTHYFSEYIGGQTSIYTNPNSAIYC